jgi:transcriptional regulator with XRE-family HTH domain
MSDEQAAAGGSLRERTAEEVRVALARKRMSASQLARLMKKSQAYVWRRLSGETAFDVDDLEAIGGILDVAPVDLLPRNAVSTAGIKPPYVPGAVRPPDRRPKGRADSRVSDRRSRQKRPLTPEEKALLAA